MNPRARTRLNAAAIAVAMVIAAAFAASCDPVRSDSVDALGGEAPGVPRGPNHRPGQPCLLCHDGKVGNPPEFSVAGTVFHDATSKTGVSGVTVNLTDSTGKTHSLGSNGAGNFYATPSQWTPTYPVHVTLSYQGQTVKMNSRVGRDGSCAGCHFDPQGPTSPGHIYVVGAAP